MLRKAGDIYVRSQPLKEKARWTPVSSRGIAQGRKTRAQIPVPPAPSDPVLIFLPPQRRPMPEHTSPDRLLLPHMQGMV